jgi:hypothetical protein
MNRPVDAKRHLREVSPGQKEAAMISEVKATLAVIAVLGVVGPVRAHHAIQAQFDFEKPIQVTGVLKKVSWVNPHSYFTLEGKEAKDSSGKVQTWLFEMGGTAGLRKAGLSGRGVFKIGDIYTINGFAAKDGSTLSWLKDLKGPDGRLITLWYGDPDGK